MENIIFCAMIVHSSFVLFSNFTLSLYFVHMALFQSFTSSHVALFLCFSFSMKHFLHVALFPCTFFCVAISSRSGFFILHFCHVPLSPCCTFSALFSFHVLLFLSVFVFSPCFTFFILHLFRVALF